MTVLQTIAVAFAMFSALPVPQFEWNEKNMRYAMCGFPLIGLVCGGLWCLCGVLPLPELARAAAFCLVPVAITGGIHLDGYADTSDALSSYGDREKKLEILKDSHCGAFAVIRLCCYFVAYFGLCGSVRFTPRAGLCWTLALVLERALSGFAVAAFPLAAGWRQQRFWRCGAMISWQKSSLAASPATWPGGFCSGPSCGCWRRWPSASGEECCK